MTIGLSLGPRYSISLKRGPKNKDKRLPRITRPLNHTEVSKARPKEKEFSLHDGDGLFLLVKTTGKKHWRFRYLRPGTKTGTTLALGNYPALSLADARAMRDEKLALLAKGIDPQESVAKEQE